MNKNFLLPLYFRDLVFVSSSFFYFLLSHQTKVTRRDGEQLDTGGGQVRAEREATEKY
jgi:hypothetical protein